MKEKYYKHKVFAILLLLLAIGGLGFSSQVQGQTCIVSHVSGDEAVGNACLYLVTPPTGTTISSSEWSATAGYISDSRKIGNDIWEVTWSAPGNATVSVNIKVEGSEEVISCNLPRIIKVNKSILKERITFANANYPTGTYAPSNAAFYTTASWNSYTTALANANTVYDNINVTQTEVNNTVNALNTAINGLALTSNELKRNPRNFFLTVTPPSNNLICGTDVRFDLNVATTSELRGYDYYCFVNNQGNARQTQLYLELPDGYTQYFTAERANIDSKWVPFSVITRGGSPITGIYRYASYGAYATMNLTNFAQNLTESVEIPYKVVWRVRLAPTGSMPDDDCSGLFDGCTCSDEGNWATVGYYEGTLVIPAKKTPIKPIIEANLTDNQFICSEDFTTLRSVAKHPEGSYYTWYKGSTVISEGVDNKVIVVNHADVSENGVNFTLKVNDFDKCSARTSDPLNIKAAQKPQVTTQSLSILRGSAVNLQNAITDYNASYTYEYFSDENCMNPVPNNLTGLAARNHTYWVQVTNPVNKCETIKPISIAVQALDFGVQQASNDPVCLGSQVTYIVTITNNSGLAANQPVVVANVFGSGLSYQSHEGAGFNNNTGVWTIPTLGNEESDTLKITFNTTSVTSADLKITSTITSANGADIEIGEQTPYEKIIVVNSIPDAPTLTMNPENGVICETGIITLTAAGQSGGIYVWYKDNDLLEGQTSTLLQADNADAGTYAVSIKVNNCTSERSNEKVVIVSSNPSVKINSPDPQLCVNDSIQLTGEAETGASTRWDISDESLAVITTTDEGNYFLKGLATGTVEVRYTATNMYGCSNTDTVEVEVINCATNIAGTVFPFVNIDGQNDFNKEFPIIVKLKEFPIDIAEESALDSLKYGTVIDSTTALYYDGTKLIGNTPKFPGYIGGTSNKGDTITWENTIKRHDYKLGNETLLIAEKPAQAIGYFQFTKIIRPGTYVLEIKREGFITRWAKVTIVERVNNLGHRELIFGDFDGDLKITEADASSIWSNRKQYVSTNSPYDFDFKSDIDGNSAINSLDYRQVLLKIGANILNYNDTKVLFDELDIKFP